LVPLSKREHYAKSQSESQIVIAQDMADKKANCKYMTSKITNARRNTETQRKSQQRTPVNAKVP
jgi:hypothetical protein